MQAKRPFLSYAVLSTSIALYLIALTQPCFDTSSAPGEGGQGMAMLLSGVFGFFSSGTGLRWLANPVLFFAWIQLYRKPKSSLIAGIVATLISLSFLLCQDIIINEGGGTASITDMRPGYWLWLASIITMVPGNILLKLFVPESAPKEDPAPWNK